MMSAAAALFGAERRAAAAGRRGIRILDCEAAAGDRFDEVDLGTLEVPDADGINIELDAVRFEYLVAVATGLFDHQPVLKARASPALHEHAQTAVLLLLFGQKLGDFGGCRRRHVNHVISPGSNRADPTGEIIQYCPFVPPLLPDALWRLATSKWAEIEAKLPDLAPT